MGPHSRPPPRTPGAGGETGTGQEWDVFVSYARMDAWRVRPVIEVLRDHGLRVFVDESEVADFGSITGTITTELARAKVLLACYSRRYPERRACQWELTVAYLAGQREGDPRRRVLVVNPEPSAEHIHPIELRDARHLPAPDPAGGAAFAAAVAARVRAVDRPIGAIEPVTPPRWLPAPVRTGSPRFVGRLAELWRLHSALHPRHAALVTGTSIAGAVQLRGLGGIGKSLLAEEYALRFAAAFPGGVFWLPLEGSVRPGPDPGPRAMARYARRVRTVAAVMGVAPDGPLERVLSLLALAIEDRGQPCLWVVDDVPAGLSGEQWAFLRGPHPLAATLITTRSRHHEGMTAALDLAPLPDDDARLLLAGGGSPPGPVRPAAPAAGVRAGLVAELGGHPLALDLAGLLLRDRLLAAPAGTPPVAAATPDPAGGSVLSTPVGDWLERAAQHVGVLPGGHASGLSTTLAADLLGRTGTGLDVLRITVAVAPDWITPEAVAQVLDAADGTGTRAALAAVHDAMAELDSCSLLARSGSRRAVTVVPVVGYLLRRHDPDPGRAHRLGALASAARTGRNGSTMAGEESVPTERLPMPARPHAAPTDLERMAAFDIQVELAMRVGVQRLDEDAGMLREALSSLYKLFQFTRDTLRRYGPEIRRSGTDVYAVADKLLNAVLRPFLTRWHPRLAAHEAARPADRDPREHEHRWDQAAQLRADLAALHIPLVEITRDLAAISGTDLGIS